jgi:flavodoxin
MFTHTLVVYDSKYGNTAEYARKLTLVMGPSMCIRPDEFKEEYKEKFNFTVLMSPVYMGKLYPSIMAFAEKHIDWLKKNKTAIVVCGQATGPYALHYLEPLAGLLGDCCAYQGVVGGRLLVNKLDKEDFNSIKSYNEGLGQEMKDVDAFNLDGFLELAARIKDCAEAKFDALPVSDVRTAFEDFLKSHNTCALCTGHDDYVRATPIEYRYANGRFYFLTEGGRKFLSIFKNPKVSLSVYDPYKGTSTVAGMSLAGVVEDIVMDPLSPAFQPFVETWKMNPKKLAESLHKMNGLVVKLVEGEFFWYGFHKAGGNVKQLYRF